MIVPPYTPTIRRGKAARGERLKRARSSGIQNPGERRSRWRRQDLGHRIARVHPELPDREADFQKSTREIEQTRRLSADQRAARRAALRRACLQGCEQSCAGAAKSEFGRHIIEKNLARVGDRPNRGDRALIDGDKVRGVRPPHPARDRLRGLVAQPGREKGRIVSMVCDTKFGDRAAKNRAGLLGVFHPCVANDHSCIQRQDAKRGKGGESIPVHGRTLTSGERRFHPVASLSPRSLAIRNGAR